MKEVEKLKKLVRMIEEANEDIRKVAIETKKKMEKIRVDTSDWDRIDEINEHMFENYDILVVWDYNECYTVSPQITADGTVALYSTDGEAIDPVFRDSVLLADVRDVLAFYNAIEELIEIAKEKGILIEGGD